MMYSEEERNEIEAVFIRSWDEAEKFFNREPPQPNLDFARLKMRLSLIRLLRERGYDRHLLLGRSGVDFMVLRAQKPEARIGQPRIVLDITDIRGVSAHLIAENVNVFIATDRIEITPELENLLIPLLAYPIDYGED
jgi:hypothetical protein